MDLVSFNLRAKSCHALRQINPIGTVFPPNPCAEPDAGDRSLSIFAQAVLRPANLPGSIGFAQCR